MTLWNAIDVIQSQFYNLKLVLNADKTKHMLFSSSKKMHWYIITYKTILGLLPSYLCCLIQWKSVGKYSLHSQNGHTLSVPFVRTELGKKAFMYAAPSN